jgi:hypothetical protein
LPPPESESFDFPDHAALRGCYVRLSTRQAVERYLNERLEPGVSARAIIGRIRRTLCFVACIAETFASLLVKALSTVSWIKC